MILTFSILKAGGKMSEENSHVEKQPKNPITYQNKDVVSKIFGENLREKSLAVYGVNIPKITEVLPTNLPVIEANEMQIFFCCQGCWYL